MYENCEAVIRCYPEIINVLQEEIKDEMDKDVNEAIGIFLNTLIGYHARICYLRLSNR